MLEKEGERKWARGEEGRELYPFAGDKPIRVWSLIKAR